MRTLTAAVKRRLVAFDKNASIQSVSTTALGESAPDAGKKGGEDEDGTPQKRKSSKEDEDENAEENEEFQEGKLRFAGEWEVLSAEARDSTVSSVIFQSSIAL